MLSVRERGYDISREMAEIGGMRPGYRNQQKKSVLFKAPGLLMVTRRGAMPIRFHR